jgi:lipopolysaccharide transport system ATP-binding protein
VTHSTEQVVRHCSRALLLENGRLIDDGEPRQIANRYLDLLLGAREPGSAPAGPAWSQGAADTDSEVSLVEARTGYCRSEYRWGNGGAKVVDVKLMQAGNPLHEIQYDAGQRMAIRVAVNFEEACEYPVFGFFIKTPDGVTVYGNSTKTMRLPAHLSAAAGQTVCVQFVCELNLGSGSYLLSVGVSAMRGTEVVPLDRRYDVLHFDVVNLSGAVGLADLHAECAPMDEGC